MGTRFRAGEGILLIEIGDDGICNMKIICRSFI